MPQFSPVPPGLPSRPPTRTEQAARHRPRRPAGFAGGRRRLTAPRGRGFELIEVGGVSVVIGLSLALLFALGTPWRGTITVSGHPIDAVVRDLGLGYFHA